MQAHIEEKKSTHYSSFWWHRLRCKLVFRLQTACCAIIFGVEKQYQIKQKNKQTKIVTTTAIIYCLAELCFRLKFITHSHYTNNTMKWHVQPCCIDVMSIIFSARSLFQLQIIFKFTFECTLKIAQRCKTLSLHRLMICQLVQQKIRLIHNSNGNSSNNSKNAILMNDKNKIEQSIDWVETWNWKAQKSWAKEKKCTEITRFFLSFWYHKFSTKSPHI